MTPFVSSPEQLAVIPVLHKPSIDWMFEHRGHVLPSPPIDLHATPSVASPMRQKSVDFEHDFEEEPHAKVPAVKLHVVPLVPDVPLDPEVPLEPELPLVPDVPLDREVPLDPELPFPVFSSEQAVDAERIKATLAHVAASGRVSRKFFIGDSISPEGMGEFGTYP